MEKFKLGDKRIQLTQQEIFQFEHLKVNSIQRSKIFPLKQ